MDLFLDYHKREWSTATFLHAILSNTGTPKSERLCFHRTDLREYIFSDCLG